MKNGVVRESCGAANLSKSRAGSYNPCRSLPTNKRREKFQDIHNRTELVSNAGIWYLFTHSYVCINYNITLSITCNYTRLPIARALGSLKTTFTTMC